MQQFEDFSKAGVSLESDDAARHLITERSPYWVGDIRGLTERAQRAFESGLHSAVAVPFVSASRAVGALSLFSRKPRPAEPDLLSILAHIGAEIGQFVARSRAQAELEAERKALAQKVDERTAELSRANEELARTGKMKDQFLASMSHELRTPISAILGLSEFLQQGIHGVLNEKQARSVKTIEESGRHLLALVDDILDISKIEAGKVRLEPLPVWAEPVCSGALRFVSQAAQRKHLSAKYVVEPPSLKLRADEKRLRQILVNLLSNAVKFTPEGGEIGIEAMEDESAGAVIFRVWDTGIGIAREDLPRLFQPFTQLDSRLSRQHAGAGLGLSLVKKLVDLHGGSVGIESEPGRGTRVTVSLPKGLSGLIPLPGRDASAADGFPALTPPDGTGQIVLLAEDNEAIAETASRFLELRGYRVVHATDGGDAVAKAIEFKPSLVLMDVHMPRMDGLEATRRIRQAPEVCQVPIVAVTALVMPGDRERCLEAGCDEYLAKPLGLKTLAAVVRRFVSGQQGP
jgi:signal transduction histidine kinase/ActR/RegA family two-component response regulator